MLQRVDEDRTIQFRREPSTIVRTNLDIIHNFTAWSPCPSLQPKLVGFCGKLYPMLVKTGWKDVKDPVLFKVEELDAYCEKHWHKRDFAKYNDLSNKHNKYCIRPNAVKFFNKEYKCADLLDVHPVFIVNAAEWVNKPDIRDWRGRVKKCEININPNLGNYEFFRVLDNYTAYQELCMWLGNKAAPEKPIPFIDDKTMAEAKGFDLKFSFRKDPEQKKKGKKK